ncbi:MAG: DUF6198 family protein [Acutalibacteraceae bacterium]
MKRTTLCLPAEAVYVAANLLLSLAVAMISATDFGVSMVVAPAYILHLKTEIFTFGQCEYMIQALLFAVFCLLMRQVKAVYFSSFLTCLIYGAMLDFWRWAVPHFNPSVTPPGCLPLALRVVYFVLGMLLTALSIALLFRTYLYPQVYDFFVKGVSERFSFNRTVVKISFDASCLAVSCLMTLLFFGTFRGIGVGTVVMTCLNGLLIGLCGKLLDRFVTVRPLLPRFAAAFDLKK